MDSITKFLSQTPTAKAWQQIGVKHHHGICVPLFSLRTQHSAGLGEYLDLLPLIDWCPTVGFDVIQLLPLNDTGTETSPYSALSAFALNPVHLSLHALPEWQNVEGLLEIYEELQQLNRLQRIAHERVFSLKEAFLRAYSKALFPQFASSKNYRQFTENAPWLEKDSLFKALKIKQQRKSWLDWPEEWKHPSENQLHALKEAHQDEVNYHSFLQFHCFQQLRQVHDHATEKGVWLKGDIPILFSKDCADVWAHRSLFHLDFSAGAPPDMYNAEGQDWGFPLYNWSEMEKERYAWWGARLQAAAQYYDMYRLDHIVGFYRIWAKYLTDPAQRRGFIPEDPNSWISQGDRILKALIATNPLLPIGEDLGVIPPEVRQNLRSLGICGTKVMRWERRWNEDRSVIPYSSYEPLSMTTVSTHDSEPLALWWRNNAEEAREFCTFKQWVYAPQLSRMQQREILYDSHHTSSLLHINLLQEYLPLIDGGCWDRLEDERINVPGSISATNWTYRFRLSVEEIVANTQLANEIKNILA